MIRRLLRWSGFAAAALVVLGLVLFGIAFAINAHDPELSPQARTLLTPPPNPYRPEDNIYLAMAGADAPPGEPVIAVGQLKVAEYNRRAEQARRDPASFAFESIHVPENPQRLVFQGDCSFLQPSGESVWQTAVRHRREVETLLAENRELYQRYLALHDLHGYYETAQPSWLMPFPGWPVCERRVFLAQYVLNMRSAGAALQRQALIDLQSDIALWRTIFKGDGTLVSKMIAIAYLGGDYLVLADTIADPSISLPTGASDGGPVVPVADLEDWDLGSTFAAEFRVTSFILRQTASLYATSWTPDGVPSGTVHRWLARFNNQMRGHFFKLNATENLLARETTRRTQRQRDPAMFFRTQKDTLPDPTALPEGLDAWLELLTYNPGGKVMGIIGGVEHDQATLRAWDAAALQRLVRLSLEIRRQHVQKSAIPDFLKQHPEWSTHPADGRPFLWNAETGELRIQTVGKQPPERRFWVRVWQGSG